MPFDNLHRTQFGDIDLLLDARSRLSNKTDWVQGRFRDGDRVCLAASVMAIVSVL
jgi:hypothetical protein